MLNTWAIAELRKHIRYHIKRAVYEYAGNNPSLRIHVYDGTVSSVRFAIVDSDGKHETCYDVAIRKLGKRPVF